MDPNALGSLKKFLYYRIRIVEVTPCRSRSLVLINQSQKQLTLSTQQLLPIDYNVTKIENVNMKAIPEANIIVRGNGTVTGTSSSNATDISPADQVTNHSSSASSSSSSYSSTLRNPTEEDLPEEDQNAKDSALSHPSLNRVNSLPKPPRVQIRVEENTKQHQQEQHLVRCRMVERQESIKLKPILAGQDGAATASSSSKLQANGKRESSTKASTESLNLKGLTKFYNITTYKASKLWNKKPINASE